MALPLDTLLNVKKTFYLLKGILVVFGYMLKLVES